MGSVVPPKKESGGALIVFVIVVLIFIGMAGSGDNDTPDLDHVPPSVPSDVGTLKP